MSTNSMQNHRQTIISAADLAQHVSDPQWVLLDCRHDLLNPQAGPDAFAAGHLPGAQFASIDHDLSSAKVGPDGKFRGRHPLPDKAAFIETLRRWGVSDDTQVVAYDAHGGMYAARLWWMLRWVGHAKVAVLDGGVAAWQANGGALSGEVQARAPGQLSLRTSLVRTVDAQHILANLNGGPDQVVDARAPDRFRGENETIDPVGGRIPGAKNRFFKDNLTADGQFKASAQLRDEFGAVVGDVSHAIMQCGSGVTACHNLLALEIAGLPGAALYPGSWSEWCADTSRPMATGAAN
jgi:thiosulfate/3-mercaptopyruvate sulfurtransferase